MHALNSGKIRYYDKGEKRPEIVNKVVNYKNPCFCRKYSGLCMDLRALEAQYYYDLETDYITDPMIVQHGT